METLPFLKDLAIVTGVAAITVLVFNRLRFPLVFGLLVAGLLIGPHTPPFSLVSNLETLETLADLGVVLLLFGLGLEFDLRGLRRNATAAAIITAVEILLMFGIGFEAARLMGWSPIDRVFLGAMLSISSTAIVVAVLRELGRMDQEASRIVFAVLVLEDVAAILLLVIVSGYAATGDLALREAGFVVGRMLLFLVALGVAGLALVPRLVDYLARRNNAQILVLSVLGLALGAAVASELSGFHMGLGAFLMGALVAESSQSRQVEHQLRPVHDLFAGIFFVAMGTLVDPGVLTQYWLPTVIVSLVVIVGKLVSGAAAAYLVGFAPATAIGVGAALAQVGEFSFVIAEVGISSGTMSPALFSIIVGASAITSFVSPVMIRFDHQILHRMRRLTPPSLRTYGQVYTHWLRSVRANRTSFTDNIAHRERVALITAAALLIGFLGAGLALHTPVVDLLGGGRGVELAYWGFVVAGTVPLIWEFYRHSRNWIERLTSQAAGSGFEALRPRNVVLYSLLLLATVLVGLPVVIATAAVFDTPLATAAWVALVLAAGLMLIHRIRRLHNRVQDQLESLLKERNVPVTTEHAVELLFKDVPPGASQTQTLTVDADSWIVGKRVGEIDLRRNVGANLVLLVRATGEQAVANAETTILPNDRLVLLGSPQQIEATRSLLARRLPRQTVLEGVRPGNVYVPGPSRIAGRTIAQSGLRAGFGLQVVAVRRGGETFVNPDPEFQILADDLLVVIGPSHRILEAERWVHEPAPRSQGPAGGKASS